MELKAKIKEIKRHLEELRLLKDKPDQRRDYVRGVIGDAEAYLKDILNLLIWVDKKINK